MVGTIGDGLTLKRLARAGKGWSLTSEGEGCSVAVVGYVIAVTTGSNDI